MRRLRPIRPLLVTGLLLASLCVLWPDAARAVQLGGALNWNFGRTEQTTPRNNIVRTQFDQWYRAHLTANILRSELGTLRIGGGWRSTRTDDFGTGAAVLTGSAYKLADLNVSLSMLPTRLPMSLTFNRSISKDASGNTTSRSVLGSTLNFSARIPMPDGNPIGLSFNQSKQDARQASDSTARLATVSKRIDLGSKTRLNASYRYSDYSTDTTSVTGHGGSLSSDSQWTEHLSSSLYANLTSQDSNVTRTAAGRNVFLNNNYGGALHYRRGAEASGTLSYSFTETPQSALDDIRSQQLYGRGNLRVGARTDLRGNFAVRRLRMPTTDMDTLSTSLGVHYRPRFGWSTGVTTSLARNQMTDPTGATTSSYNSVSGNAYLSARQEYRPVRLSWGLSSHFTATGGANTQDRLTSAANISATERTLDWIRLTGTYRLTDIRETGVGTGMAPHSREHAVTLGGAFTPKTRVWLASDVLSASFSTRYQRNQSFFDGRNVGSRGFETTVNYRLWSAFQTHAGYKYAFNSDDLQGSHQEVNAGAQWHDQVFHRGTQMVEGDIRRVWLGGRIFNQESTLRYQFNYAVGLMSVSFTADTTWFSGQSGLGDTSTNNLYLSLVRTF